jgi:hypothetical protein
VPERAYAGFEATMDVLCRTRLVSAVCQYDRRTTGARLRETVAILGLAGGAAHGEQRWRDRGYLKGPWGNIGCCRPRI